MHSDDDAMVGRLLSRRELLALLGVSGIAAASDSLYGQASGSSQRNTLPECVVQPEQTEGPYFVDKMLDRTDIRTEPGTNASKPGHPLRIAFAVSQVRADGTCAPLPGAQVDLWQCDAAGVYSGVQDRTFNTVGQKFLRGHQVTDARGGANFVTIYPGWYPGRAVHVHFKIRTAAAGEPRYEFTSQLYFDEAVNDRVFAREPYAGRTGNRIRNEADGIYRNGGKQLMLPVIENADGYAGTFRLALHPGQPSQPAGGRRGGRGER